MKNKPAEPMFFSCASPGLRNWMPSVVPYDKIKKLNDVLPPFMCIKPKTQQLVRAFQTDSYMYLDTIYSPWHTDQTPGINSYLVYIGPIVVRSKDNGLACEVNAVVGSIVQLNRHILHGATGVARLLRIPLPDEHAWGEPAAVERLAWAALDTALRASDEITLKLGRNSRSS